MFRGVSQQHNTKMTLIGQNYDKIHMKRATFGISTFKKVYSAQWTKLK